MSDRPDLSREVLRKVWHVSMLVYLAAYLRCGRDAFLPWMAAWTTVVFSIETARLRSPAVGGALLRLFGGIVRPREVGRYTGVIYTTLGILLVAAFWGDRAPVVAGAVLSLAFADSAAALVGMAWGRLRFTLRGQVRTVEGTLAGLAVAFGCGLIAGLPWNAAAAGAAAVATVDCLPLPPDDNLWIPIAFAAASAAALGTGPSLPW